MANSESPIYTRPPDLRECEYKAFEANGLVGDGTTDLLASPGVAASHRVHRVTIVVSVADAGGSVSIEDETGNVLVVVPTIVVGTHSFVWGDFPWGYVIKGNEKLLAVIAGSTTTDVSIQGYATS